MAGWQIMTVWIVAFIAIICITAIIFGDNK